MSAGQNRGAKVLNKLGLEWQAFQDSHAGLTDSQVVAPGVVGEWSVKDLITHVTIWEQEALKHLPLIVAGGSPPRYSTTYGGIDAFNALMMTPRRGLALSEVRQQAATSHRQLIGYIESVPPELMASESRFRRRLRLDTYGHYPIHTEHIMKWRKRS